MAGPDCLIAVCPNCGRTPIVLSLPLTDDEEQVAFARDARRGGYRIEAASADRAAGLLGRCQCVANALAAQPALPGVADDQP